MSPSRGSSAGRPTTAGEQHRDDDDDTAVHQQSSSALIHARRNFSFLINPTQTSPADRPARLRTRALLRTIRYVGQFIVWRLVRWAKYAAVGALVAAVGATTIGGFMSGAAWIVAPPSIGASIIAATIWGVGKYMARRLHRRWKETGMDVGAARREEQDGSPTTREQDLRKQLNPQAIPW